VAPKPKIDPSFQPFEVVQGGVEDEFPITKTAPQPPGNKDWLRELPLFTGFVSHGKLMRGAYLDSYGIAQIEDYAILLFNLTPAMGEPVRKWVNSFKFSQDNILDGIIPNPPQEEETNGQHNLPVSEPR